MLIQANQHHSPQMFSQRRFQEECVYSIVLFVCLLFLHTQLDKRLFSFFGDEGNESGSGLWVFAFGLVPIFGQFDPLSLRDQRNAPPYQVRVRMRNMMTMIVVVIIIKTMDLYDLQKTKTNKRI